MCFQIAATKMDPNHFLIWILLRFELFDYFNGSRSSKDQVFDVATKLLEESPVACDAFGDENQLNLQDEQLQWNRLTEEMLYLFIVIVGAVRSSHPSSLSHHKCGMMMTNLCCAFR